jgi:hypothetical protein
MTRPRRAVEFDGSIQARENGDAYVRRDDAQGHVIVGISVALLTTKSRFAASLLVVLHVPSFSVQFRRDACYSGYNSGKC